MKNYNSLYSFIQKIIKELYPVAKVPRECKDLLNDLAIKICIDYITAGAKLCRHANRVTINSDAIVAITNVWLWSFDHSLISFAGDVWEEYINSDKKGSKKYVKAGLRISPTRIKKITQPFIYAGQSIGETAYIYLAAIIERILLDIFAQIPTTQSIITVCDIYNTINRIEYLQKLLYGYFIAGVGTIGNKVLATNRKHYLKYQELTA